MTNSGRKLSHTAKTGYFGFLVVSIISDALLTDAADNKAVLAGSNVNFTCKTDDRLTAIWFHDKSDHNATITNGPKNASSQIPFYNGMKVKNMTRFQGRYSVLHDSADTYTLLIRAVQMDDAGKYQCREVESLSLNLDAELIVLVSDPVCTQTELFNKESDEISSMLELSCSVNYSGNWAPVMSWQRDGGAVITAGVVNNTVAYKSVTYSLTVAATRNLTGTKYTCTTYFTETNRPINASIKNVPSYRYEWSITWPTTDSKSLKTSRLDFGNTGVRFKEFNSLLIGCLAAVLIVVICVAFAARHFRKNTVCHWPCQSNYRQSWSRNERAVESDYITSTEQTMSRSLRRSTKIRQKSQQSNIGADGTVYAQLDVTLLSCSKMSTKSVPSNKVQVECVYASIDHNLSAQNPSTLRTLRLETMMDNLGFDLKTIDDDSIEIGLD